MILRKNEILTITVFGDPEKLNGYACTEISRKTFETAAQFARLAANNNTHLQLASSNTFRSYIYFAEPGPAACVTFILQSSAPAQPGRLRYIYFAELGPARPAV